MNTFGEDAEALSIAQEMLKNKSKLGSVLKPRPFEEEEEEAPPETV